MRALKLAWLYLRYGRCGVTTQAHEGIETCTVRWSRGWFVCNNSSPWGHWNSGDISFGFGSTRNNSSPWGHWNFKRCQLHSLCFVNRKSSKSEGKFPTFGSGNPHYPKETCREFSFFHLSSRKESSIHCFLPNRVIRVRLCQRLPERFAFNVMSFDSAPAPGWRAVCFIRACSIR